MIAPALQTVEILRFPEETTRAKHALDALTRAAVHTVTTETYLGGADLLLLWGPGAPNRWPAMQTQQVLGKHVLALDLAYWDRARKVRVSIDHAHPHQWVMKTNWPTARLTADRIVTSESHWDPTGPIILAEIGAKAKQQYGAAVDTWERQMLAMCRAQWPGRPIITRPKPRVPDPQIEAGLKGASLVITWHSNVAVDAIRLGIPAVCMDGAARAVCHATIQTEPAPLPRPIRDRFLANLAWFQWNPQTEGAAFWAWVSEMLS